MWKDCGIDGIRSPNGIYFYDIEQMSYYGTDKVYNLILEQGIPKAKCWDGTIKNITLNNDFDLCIIENNKEIPFTKTYSRYINFEREFENVDKLIEYISEKNELNGIIFETFEENSIYKQLFCDLIDKIFELDNDKIKQILKNNPYEMLIEEFINLI